MSWTTFYPFQLGIEVSFASGVVPSNRSSSLLPLSQPPLYSPNTISKEFIVQIKVESVEIMVSF